MCCICSVLKNIFFKFIHNKNNAKTQDIKDSP
jgi:hypothetical protein